MKIIDNAIMHQDYKARENLEREISIMKMLKSCDNVVQIFMAGVSETTMMQLPSGSYMGVDAKFVGFTVTVVLSVPY